MAEKKEKQYVSDNAQLMAEWHPTKNQNLKTNDTAIFSGKTVCDPRQSVRLCGMVLGAGQICGDF